MIRSAFALLLLAPVAGAQKDAGASVSGSVRDSAGRPIADAEVGVLGSVRVRTDAAGEYRIANLVAGRAMVTARRIGFVAETRPLRLVEGEGRQLDFVLAASVQSLDPASVVAKREPYDARLAGFHERSKQQIGHFVTRERIDRANSATLVDVLREIPGMRISGLGLGTRLVRIRSSTCPPLIFVDGFPASAGEFDLDMIDVKTVEGIEVYSGLGSLPAEFSGPRDLDRCGVIAIWSRPARSRRGEVALAAARPQAGGPVAAAVAAAAEPYTLDQVEVGARPDSGTAGPVYPDSLYRAGTTGRVVIEFVVDTEGRVEPASLDVLEATHPGFVDAVRVALLAAHFQAARVGGHAVRQYVQLPFVFGAERAKGLGRPPG